MKANFKNISILGLAVIFFVSAILCCCFTDTVQADEPTPSCHQTSNEKDSSKSEKDCKCDQSFTIVKKVVSLNDRLVAVATFVIEQQVESQFYVSSFVVAYQAPPQFYDTSPLYIKHSVLRI